MEECGTMRTSPSVAEPALIRRGIFCTARKRAYVLDVAVPVLSRSYWGRLKAQHLPDTGLSVGKTEKLFALVDSFSPANQRLFGFSHGRPGYRDCGTGGAA